MRECTEPEGHDQHMRMNGECPWCGASASEQAGTMSDAEFVALGGTLPDEM